MFFKFYFNLKFQTQHVLTLTTTSFIPQNGKTRIHDFTYPFPNYIDLNSKKKSGTISTHISR